ncbi:MAG: imidazoleglycerol-phosphate dehydratase HisB [Armatimonadetes bacterium]|nr:imidazoleglycerol-phosphate dehydratase HisB [Armatimonadota bacterium]
MPSNQSGPAPRTAACERNTIETSVSVMLALDGEGRADIQTGVGFLDHMLALFSRHSGIDLTVEADGDLHIDDHHTVEDVGIAMGQALRRALGDCAGIRRFADATVPMDEALALCAVDISGRGMALTQIELSRPKVGQFATEMAPEFFRAVAANAGVTLHIRQLGGSNMHHVLEAAFKAWGRAMRSAVERVDATGRVPSTKGVL